MEFKNLTGFEPEGTLGYVGESLCRIVSCVGVSSPCQLCVLKGVCTDDDYEDYDCLHNNINFTKYKHDDSDGVDILIKIEFDKIERAKQKIQTQEDLIQKSVNMIAKLNAAKKEGADERI